MLFIFQIVVGLCEKLYLAIEKNEKNYDLLLTFEYFFIYLYIYINKLI